MEQLVFHCGHRSSRVNGLFCAFSGELNFSQVSSGGPIFNKLAFFLVFI